MSGPENPTSPSVPPGTPPEFAFLKRAPLFRNLSDQLLSQIYTVGEIVECGPGHVIFSEGSPGFDLFVVKSGVVEVRKDGESSSQNPRVVSYLSTGECLGEMSLVTGLPRSATVRVPERAEVFRVPGTAFDRLLHEEASVALSLAKILAYRLQIANQLHMSDSASTKHLAGDLEFFDLPEVCQTLTQGRRTGVMLIRTMAGEGMLYFKEGDIRHARMGLLRGRDAVIYVFRHKLRGSFEFHSTEGYAGPLEEPTIEESPMGLVLEAVRQRDEIDAMRSRLPGPDHVFIRQTEQPKWDFHKGDPGVRETRRAWAPSGEQEISLAARVWDEIGRARSFGALLKEHLAHEHTVYAIVTTWTRTGSIR
jgi:CRP-like cAMP-binding protein